MAKEHFSPQQRIGSVIFLREAEILTKPRKAVFLCRCGNEFTAYLGNVKKGKTTSCGCVRAFTYAHAPVIHGQSHRTRNYTIWAQMKARCLNEKDTAFYRYGGTFDVSILELTGNVFQVVATGGDMFLGGADFDARVQAWILDQFKKKTKIDL